MNEETISKEDLFKERIEQSKRIEELVLEIERLNNIIEELEKYLFSQLQEYGGGGIVQEYYDKLKELKEGNK